MSDAPDRVVLDPSRGRVLEQARPIPPSFRRGQPPSAAILRSLALGAVAGMRSMLPLALLAAAANSPDTPVARALAPMDVLRRLRAPAALAALGLVAAGELVFDKLPFVPARVSLGPLTGRAVIGAAAGAITSSAAGGLALNGARRGAVAAILTGYAAYVCRRALSRHTRIPGPVWGLVEDALALGLGIIALLPSLAPALQELLSSGTPFGTPGHDTGHDRHRGC